MMDCKGPLFHCDMVLGKGERRARDIEAIEKFVRVMQVSWSHLSNEGLRKRRGRIFGHTNEEASKILHSVSLGEVKGLGRGCTIYTEILGAG
jgi:hypothetical protein